MKREFFGGSYHERGCIQCRRWKWTEPRSAVSIRYYTQKGKGKPQKGKSKRQKGKGKRLDKGKGKDVAQERGC